MGALIVSICLAYLLGAIPTSFIFGKLFAGVDIRTCGSKNVGATNVYRVVGKLPGILTLFVDIAKGAIAVGILAPLFYQQDIPLIKLHHYQILMVLAVVSGHNWTPFLKFKGGKGIATSTGALLILCPKIMLLTAVVWGVIFGLTKIVSLASIIASIFLPIIASFFGDIYITSLAITLCIVSAVKHRSNIRRLIRGEERSL